MAGWVVGRVANYEVSKSFLKKEGEKGMAFNKFWNFVPDNDNPTVLNMYIYGEICSASSFFGSEDDVVASNFIKDLNSYPDVKTINVYINSPGGSVFAAAAIINQLRNHPAVVQTWCDGICASAAVGILLAADPGYRHMSHASLLMIHNPSTRAEGDQRVFLKTADLLAKVKKTLLNIYQEGTGLPEDKLAEMMDADTYLDADEALAMNFIDVITEKPVVYDLHDRRQIICNGVAMDVAAELDLDKLQSHLDKLKMTTSKVKKGGTVVNFEEFLASLEESQRDIVNEAISAQIQEKITQLEEAHSAEVQSLNEQIATLTEQVTSLKAQIEKNSSSDKESNPIINSLPPEAQALLAQARADAIAAQKALQQLQEAQAFAEFKETFSSLKNLPLTDKHIKAMQPLAKENPEMYSELRTLLEVANAAMGAGFVPVGSDCGTDVPIDAFTTIEQRISEYRREHAEADYNTAMRAVLAADPSLYDAYRDGIYS